MSEEAKAETPAPKAGGSKLVPILMVMNTLLVGGVLVFVMKKQPVAVVAPAAAGEHAKEGEHGKEGEAAGGEHGEKGKPPGPGHMVKLENFVIQLKAVDAERYVRVAFDIEVGLPADEEVIKPRISQIRDSIISYFSDRTLDELRGSDGMDNIKQTLKKRLDGIVPGGRIKAIYITDFIIQ